MFTSNSKKVSLWVKYVCANNLYNLLTIGAKFLTAL